MSGSDLRKDVVVFQLEDRQIDQQLGQHEESIQNHQKHHSHLKKPNVRQDCRWGDTSGGEESSHWSKSLEKHSVTWKQACWSKACRSYNMLIVWFPDSPSPPKQQPFLLRTLYTPTSRPLEKHLPGLFVTLVCCLIIVPFVFEYKSCQLSCWWSQSCVCTSRMQPHHFWLVAVAVELLLWSTGLSQFI